MDNPGGSHSIGPLRAQQLLAFAGLRVAPALTAGAIVCSHTMQIGDGILVAACMLVAARALDPGRELSRLMPLASLVNWMLMPAAGLGLALLVSVALRPLSLTEVPSALLGSLLVLALGAWVVTRFERRVEARVAVVGPPTLARSLARELELTGIGRYRVVGWIDAGAPDLVPDMPRLGPLAEIGEIIGRDQIDLIVNAAGEDAGDEQRPRSLSSHDVVEQVAASCLGQDVRLIGLNQLHEELFGHVPLATLDAAFFQYLMHPKFRGGSQFGKRALDLAVGGLAAIFFAPLLAMAAIAIKLSDGGPVLFRQRRVGAGGRDFEIVKLRTMRVNADSRGAEWSRENDDRVTKVGKILRRTHLDEVPQLWNVLRDEMSLVGPRPEQPDIVAQLEWQIPFYDRRELVKPGITGWAQIRCGYAGTEEGTAWKLCHDLYYLKHRSCALDAMIVMQTLVTAVHDVQFAVRAPDENFVLDAVRGTADA
jgi:exopolysaccharide biosynthesis polyprenyl glycosylphosphotransferase